MVGVSQNWAIILHAAREELLKQQRALDGQIGRLTAALADGEVESRSVLLAIKAREAEKARVDRALASLTESRPRRRRRAPSRRGSTKR
jgi:hypothetical protein